MSASDDRTCRLWTVALSTNRVDGQQHVTECVQATQVLYGHTARLWDCQFGSGHGVLVTASEDCTARYAANFTTHKCVADVDSVRWLKVAFTSTASYFK